MQEGLIPGEAVLLFVLAIAADKCIRRAARANRRAKREEWLREFFNSVGRVEQ